MSTKSLICPLCGRILESWTYGGKCGDCEELTRRLLEDRTYAIPEPLKAYVRGPTWLLPEHRVKLAAIRAGEITKEGNFRQDIDIAIAVATESGTEEERKYVEKTLLPHYKSCDEIRRVSFSNRETKERQLADILSRRA